MAAAAGAAPLLRDLPDAIVLWEILVRLDPKSVLRCRAVRRDWRSATSTRAFLLAHHARQPALPILSHYANHDHSHKVIRAFDHQAGKADTVVRFDEPYHLVASCDGLLLFERRVYMAGAGVFLAVCNPATREIASPGPLGDFKIVGMYRHRPTGDYRLLLQGRSHDKSYWDPPSDRAGFYVLALGSHHPPRYVGGSETELASAILNGHAWLRDCLHFYTVHYRNPLEENPNSFNYYNVQRELVIVFDTIAESFREMRAPHVHTGSRIFEMDGMLGIYTLACNNMTAAQVVDIWVLHNYQAEVWDLRYRVELPIAEIRGEPEGLHGGWFITVVSVDGDVLLLVSTDSSLYYIDTDGKLVATLEDRCVYPESHLLKQTLVRHDFFAALEGYAVNSSPIIPSV